MARFIDQSIIITGAGSGIGRAVAQHLAGEGARLTLVDLDDRGLRSTRDLITEAVPGAPVTLVTADISHEAEVAAYVAAALTTYGRIDGFFNNAGIASREALAEDFTPEEFRTLTSINVTGTFMGLRAVLKVMREQGSGAIVNTASYDGIRAASKQIMYSSSKHAVVGMTRNTAVDYGQYGIRVNAIAPGGILTPMAEKALREQAGEDWEAALAGAGQENPMKRIGQVDDVVPVVAFLLSQDAKYVNGTVIPIDGGQSA